MAEASCRQVSSRPPLSLQLNLEQHETMLTVPGLCRDLEELCAAGFLEAYRDEHNIVRYRPASGRIA